LLGRHSGLSMYAPYYYLFTELYSPHHLVASSSPCYA
jgi:hypothetical protein